MGDIGKTRRRIELEPMPASEPLAEPAPAEPVPEPVTVPAKPALVPA